MVSSGGMYTVKLDPDDLNFDNLSYMYGNSAYAQNKVGCSHEVRALLVNLINFVTVKLSSACSDYNPSYSCCSFRDCEAFATNKVKVIVFLSARPLH